MLPAPAAAMPQDAGQKPMDERPETARVGPFTFSLGPYALTVLPDDRLPYWGTSLVSSCGLTDAQGVAMFKTSDGVIHNHPVAQTRCAINMLRNHRITGDQAYLDQSLANAQRLLDRAVSHGGGIFFPYPFRWSNPGRSVMTPPWYSAMAQGQALSAFVRLYEATGDSSWLQAAHRTFASFLVPRGSGTPWVVGVEDGLLWLDEYPTTPIDRVFNGHNFSMYGLYDYWRLTGNDQARVLALGAIHSSYVAGTQRIRVPGGISHYCSSDACLARGVKNPGYHGTHISQLRNLFWITRHWHFASLSEAFMADSPYRSSGRASLAAGIHDGYSFGADGIGTKVASVDLAATSTLRYSQREVPGGRTRPGNGIWLRIADGDLQGLWVREGSRALPLGFVDQLGFFHQRPVRVARGTYVGRTYDAAGVQTGSTRISTGSASWTYATYARINGLPSVLLTNGPLAGSWLALDARTTRDTSLFTDVDTSRFRNEIIWLTDQAITRGCGTWTFCPRASVTREQMASFLVRALRLPAATRDHFADDDASIHEGDINRLAEAGITGGCGDRRFCPRASVTREQMAAFLERALRQHGLGSVTSTATTDRSDQSSQPTATPIPTPTAEPTETPTPEPMKTPDPTSSPTPVATPTPTPSPEATPSPSVSPSPSPTPTDSPGSAEP